MQQLNPNDIPEIITLVTQIFNEQENVATDEQKRKIFTFFNTYMGKAISDCQNESISHWTFMRNVADVALKTKIVVVDSKDDMKAQFVVATMYGPNFNKDYGDAFKKKCTEEITKLYENPEDGEWVMAFNNLVFGSPTNDKFIAGLFIAVRFNNSFFIPLDSVDSVQSEQGDLEVLVTKE